MASHKRRFPHRLHSTNALLLQTRVVDPLRPDHLHGCRRLPSLTTTLAMLSLNADSGAFRDVEGVDLAHPERGGCTGARGTERPPPMHLLLLLLVLVLVLRSAAHTLFASCLRILLVLLFARRMRVGLPCVLPCVICVRLSTRLLLPFPGGNPPCGLFEVRWNRFAVPL